MHSCSRALPKLLVLRPHSYYTEKLVNALQVCHTLSHSAVPFPPTTNPQAIPCHHIHPLPNLGLGSIQPDLLLAIGNQPPDCQTLFYHVSCFSEFQVPTGVKNWMVNPTYVYPMYPGALGCEADTSHRGQHLSVPAHICSKVFAFCAGCDPTVRCYWGTLEPVKHVCLSNPRDGVISAHAQASALQLPSFKVFLLSHTVPPLPPQTIPNTTAVCLTRTLANRSIFHHLLWNFIRKPDYLVTQALIKYIFHWR